MSKILVAYFSAEAGRTARVAETIAEASGGDIFEIVPAETYTMKDLNWKNPLSRCNREKIGKKDVPVRSRVENMDEYDTVIIAHPIWHGIAPRIISTFLESYDFSGKTLLTFCTSASSPLGQSAKQLQELTPNSIWLESKRFAIGTSREEIEKWLEDVL